MGPVPVRLDPKLRRGDSHGTGLLLLTLALVIRHRVNDTVRRGSWLLAKSEAFHRLDTPELILEKARPPSIHFEVGIMNSCPQGGACMCYLNDTWAGNSLELQNGLKKYWHPRQT